MSTAQSRIGLVGCTAGKLRRPAPARELYTSELFRGRRAYVERRCERWFILSARHGLVEPERVLDPYDESLAARSEAGRRDWSRQVLAALEKRLGALDTCHFEFHAGADYRDYGLWQGLRNRGAEVSNPVRGLRLGEQIEFYRRHALGEGAEAGAEAGPVRRLRAHPARAREAGRRLWEAWTGPGIFGHRSMPEAIRPSGVARGSREHALFVTFTVAIDYMRDAAALWEASRQAYADDETRWLFDAQKVTGATSEAVSRSLVASRVARRPRQDTRIWQGVARGLAERFEGDPRLIADRSERRAPRMIAEIRSRPGEFAWLRGEKIAPLWVRMMADEVGLALRELDQVPLPVDVHVARATFACGALVGSYRGSVSDAAGEIDAVWRDGLAGSGRYPLQLDQALWLQSREGCSRRRSDRCPRAVECVLADLCVAGRISLLDASLDVETHLANDQVLPSSVPDARGPAKKPLREADRIWERIRSLAGSQGFQTKQGLPVRYRIEGDEIVVEGRRGARIPRGHVELAFERRPLRAVSDVPPECWGRSYIYAILTDPRVAAETG